MNRTKIEWALNPDGTQGYTWNPITGCLNGCEYCYARRLANTRLKARYLANDYICLIHERAYTIGGLDEAYKDPFYPRCWFDRREPALESKKPKGIFVCDMSDLFGIGIPKEWTQHVINLIRLSPQHRFYLLTKQPQNLLKFSPFPDNCWVGVTATGETALLKACSWFQRIDAKKRFISIEPLLSWGDAEWGDSLNNAVRHDIRLWLMDSKVDQVIIGSQTKPTVYPKIEWVREIVEACDKAGVKVFLKNNLKPLLDSEGCPQWAFEKPLQWEIHRRLRQELPK